MHPNYNCNYSVLALTSAIATVPSCIECNATHYQLHLQCSTIEHNAMQLHLQCRAQLTPGITLFPHSANHLVCIFVLPNQFEARARARSLLLKVHVLRSKAL